MTVQGETIANQFANRLNATYNLEMFVAGTARQTLIPAPESKDEQRYEMMDRLVAIAQKTYRKLLDHPNFIDFYGTATPIDVLEQSKIGSRPARRTGQRSLDDLRSIPWVFSWSQSRFNITGWFGTGTALDTFQKEYPDDFQRLKDLVHEWPFLRYLLIQIESNLLSSNREIMSALANLVEQPTVKEEIMSLISGDFETCLQQIEDLMGSTAETRRISKLESNKLRADALNKLHEMQLNNLVKWRDLRESDPDESEDILLRLLLLVNAISAGLKSTG
jgi:phosphoenolpyruvate carboxylase